MACAAMGTARPRWRTHGMMISTTMNGKLNDQITAEFGAAHAYLAMACLLDNMSLKVLAGRFFKQYSEELEHAMRIIRYVLEVGGTITLDGVAKPRREYKNIEDIAATALQNEKDITAKINDLVALADKEKDYATRSFLQWFVDEQVEEISTMSELLNLVKLAGNNVLQVEAVVRHEMLAEKS
jgi:ferritin